MIEQRDQEFRALSPREESLLKKLLSPTFSGCHELRLQLESVVVKQLHEDGTLLLECDTSSPAEVKYGVPMEASYVDADGGPVALMLHVKDHFMRMLEIIKYDGSTIIRPPTADDIELIPHS